jgi:hypothetical protein
MLYFILYCKQTITFVDYYIGLLCNGGTRWRSCLRHYATSRKVAGSSTDEVDFFNLPNPTSRTIALGSTQLLTEMTTRNLPGG